MQSRRSRRVQPSVTSIIKELRSHGDPRNVAGMARFGVTVPDALGISAPVLRSMARRIGRSHELAAGLWASGIHEGRILAALVDEPRLVTRGQMERWVRRFDAWDVCDAVCGNLFDRTPYAYEKAILWSRRRAEFVKRAAFALMAWLAVHDKPAPDSRFVQFLPIIEREAGDRRNFVKKAVNWALRQIGKRNARLCRRAMASGRRIRRQPSPAARWVAADALRELTVHQARFSATRRLARSVDRRGIARKARARGAV
jgi:3-methyladenine DNA glycosylase AlkD